MPAKKRAIFQVRNVEIIYKAEFAPPILEIALPQTQGPFFKTICSTYGLKFKELVLNNQAISSNFINFRRSNNLGYFEALIGVDELQTIFRNPESEIKASELTLQLMNILSKISQVNIKKQSLTVSMHCSSENTTYANFINKINTFEFTKLSFSKGATFSFKLPWPGYLINVIFDGSMLIENGLFILIQTFIDESVRRYDDVFSNTVTFLKKNIEPIFDIQINYEGRK